MSILIKYGVFAQQDILEDDITQDNDTLIVDAVYSTDVEEENGTIKIV